MSIVQPQLNISQLQVTIPNDFFGVIIGEWPISSSFVTNSPIGEIDYSIQRTWDGDANWTWANIQPYYVGSSSFVATGWNPTTNTINFSTFTGTISIGDQVYGPGLNVETCGPLAGPRAHGQRNYSGATPYVVSKTSNSITLSNSIACNPTGYTFATAAQNSSNINTGSYYFWGGADVLMAAVTANSKQVMWTLGICAPFASSNIVSSNTGYGYDVSSPPSNYQTWANFIAALCNRYPQITAFEIWNEPSFSNNGFYLGTASELADLARVAKIVTQSINPAIKIVSSPGFIGTGGYPLSNSGLAPILLANCGGGGYGSGFVVDGTQFSHINTVSTDSGSGKRHLDYVDVVAFHSYYNPLSTTYNHAINTSQMMMNSYYTKSLFSENGILVQNIYQLIQSLNQATPGKTIPVWMTEGAFTITDFGIGNYLIPTGWSSGTPNVLYTNDTTEVLVGVTISGTNVPANTTVVSTEADQTNLASATWTHASPNVISTSNTTNFYVGNAFEGPLIPPGTVIIGVSQNVSITLSNNLVNVIGNTTNIATTSITSGATYQITTLGTTTWSTYGGPVSAAIGNTFIATSTGTITGGGNVTQMYTITAWTSNATNSVLSIANTAGLTTASTLTGVIPDTYVGGPVGITAVTANTSITVTDQFWQLASVAGISYGMFSSYYKVYLSNNLTGPFTSTSATTTGAGYSDSGGNHIPVSLSNQYYGNRVFGFGIPIGTWVDAYWSPNLNVTNATTIPSATSFTISDVFYCRYTQAQLVAYMTRHLLLHAIAGCQKVFWYKWDQINYGLEQFFSGALVVEGNFLNRSQGVLQIVTLGNTNWTAVGVMGTPSVGTIFIPTGNGTLGGTGTACHPCIDPTITSSIISQVNTNINFIKGKTVASVQEGYYGGSIVSPITVYFTDGTSITA